MTTSGAAGLARILDLRLLVPGTILGLTVANLVNYAIGRPWVGYDLELLARAGARFLDGRQIYLDPAGESFWPGSIDLFYGPPALALLAIPFAPLPEPVVRLLAAPLSWVLVLAALALLVAPFTRVEGSDGWVRQRLLPALVVGSLVSQVIFFGASLGAPSIPLLVLLAATWWALESSRPGLAGIALGTAGALRLYPLVLIGALLIGRRWRAAATTIVTTGAWWAGGVLIAGPDASATYLGIAGALSNPQGILSNVAPWALLANAGGPEALVAVTRWAGLAAGGILLALGGWGLGEGRLSADQRLLGWGLAVGGMLLVAPMVWDHYASALVIVAAGIAVLRRRAWPALLPVVLGPWALVTVALVVIPLVGAVEFLRSLRRAAPVAM